jgi:hypothetical protein
MKAEHPGFGRIAVLLALSLALGGCAHKKALSPSEALTEGERTEAIRRATVWSPTRVAAVNFKAGPRDKNAFAPYQWVACDFKDEESGGKSPKFTCVTSRGRKLKVKYGPDNAEVIGEVLGSRLLWGLGFAADKMYPVRVRCRGCSEDPENDKKPAGRAIEFDPAVIEWKLAGRTLESAPGSGWKWSEIDDIGPGAPRDARSHREALKLLAAFVQHTDNKADNQRLLCPEGKTVGRTGCRAPVLMIHDVGLTFGRAALFNKNENSVRLAAWADVPVWKDPERCVAQLKGSLTGTLSDPVIREEGRAFLAGLLAQLSDAQLRDLFEIAGVARRDADKKEPSAPGPVDDWVNAFKKKRAQIVEHRCPF